MVYAMISYKEVTARLSVENLETWMALHMEPVLDVEKMQVFFAVEDIEHEEIRRRYGR